MPEILPEAWLPMLALGALMGINLPMVTLVLGIASAFGGVDLAGDLDALGNFWVMIFSAVAFMIDQVLDKLPSGVETVYNWIMVIIRVPIAVWMGGAIMGGFEGIVAGGIAGLMNEGTATGIINLLTGVSKSTIRTAGTAFTGGISNIIMSFGEDVGILFVLWKMYEVGMLT